jgi:hypothetical protein
MQQLFQFSDLFFVKKIRSSSVRRSTLKRSASREKMSAPHPIPSGMEGAVCPMTGLSADGIDRSPAATALAELAADPDITQEQETLKLFESNAHPASTQMEAASHMKAIVQFVPLNVVAGAHKANGETRRLVQEVGLSALLRFTKVFYKRCETDSLLDKFIRRHTDPHGERFALWIMEKFGDGTPWTQERKTRPRDVMVINSEKFEVSFDRSSAHVAAWHSPKRESHKWGQHFVPEDARTWMRVHFWAAREVGMFDEYPAFMDYYVRFIGHFVSVYSSKSPPFTRESARWSADPRNIEQYFTNGNVMKDLMFKTVSEAVAELPKNERMYTCSQDAEPSWPYKGR